MLYNATNIRNIIDKKKTLEGLLSKKSQNQTVKLPGASCDALQAAKEPQRKAAAIQNLSVFIPAQISALILSETRAFYFSNFKQNAYIPMFDTLI